MLFRSGLTRTFYSTLAPISEQWVPEALAVTNRTREDTLAFTPPEVAMIQWDLWLRREIVDQGLRPMFISDNNGFDWQFVNYYSWRFLGPIDLVTAAPTWAAYTRVSSGTCARISNTCVAPVTPTIPWMMPGAMPKPCSLSRNSG